MGLNVNKDPREQWSIFCLMESAHEINFEQGAHEPLRTKTNPGLLYSGRIRTGQIVAASAQATPNRPDVPLIQV